MSESQAAKILRYMKDNGSITPAQAFFELGCYRLGARIYDLRAGGHRITTEKVAQKNKAGDIVTFARYRLAEGVTK